MMLMALSSSSSTESISIRIGSTSRRGRQALLLVKARPRLVNRLPWHRRLPLASLRH